MTPARLLPRSFVAYASRRAARQTRLTSTEAKTVSPHIGFYKTFGPPLARVLLMATFTYQLAYWGWVYLEKAEIKREKSAEVEGLERRLKELTGVDSGKAKGKS